ncbi:MAG: polymer-forming cytoskeletal protein [Oscillospiraceae bacterium]|nr:polymer-forming cytoskeletal protein [Oscillospiraceae bacterium]
MFSDRKKNEKTLIVNESTEPNFPTTIAEGITIKDGKLFGTGGVKISGAFFGDVEVEGILVVSVGGSVHGNITAEDVYVNGTVDGNVLARGRVRIYPTGSLVGDVAGSSFTAEEGATFRGQSNITAGSPAAAGNTLYERNAPTLEPIET